MALTSPAGREIKGFLPGNIWAESWVMDNICQAIGSEVDRLREAIYSFGAQTFLETADWGLERWQAELALPLLLTQPMDERRARMMAHLRGTGTATVAVVKNVASAFENGEVDVIEHIPRYGITVMFVDTRGIPTNVADVQSACRAVVPAHLTIDYLFRYVIWDEHDARNLTWNASDAEPDLTWDWWDRNP